MSTKAIIAILGGLGLFAPAIAATTSQPKTPAKTAKAPAADSHIVARRCASNVEARDRDKQSLTEEQVDVVIKGKLGDVESCWTGLAAEKRKADTTAVLKLEIDDQGEVQTVEITGRVPAEMKRCIATAAVRWSFPETDVKVDAQFFEYAVSLRAK